LYDCKEASKIDWKLDEDEEEEEEAMGEIAPTTPQCIHSSPDTDTALRTLHQHDMDQAKHD
jgi:hypothetical protein